MRIETDRLVIRPFARTDAPALHAALSDPAVMRRIEPPFSRAQTAAFVAREGLCDPPRVYAVAERAGGAVIGHVIFHPFDASAWELGWVLRRDRWGRGYASELTRALIGAARERGVPALVIECAPDNAASLRVAEAFGFSRVAEEAGCLVHRLELTGEAP